MLTSQKLIELAEAVADGAHPDWDVAESKADNDADRALIRQLRAAAEIGRRRATIYTSSLTSDCLGPRFEVTAGATWGTLRILEKVGRGHFGDVYRAWDPALDREVALKLLRTPHGRPRTAEAQVVEEGRLMARIRHPNVATIYGAQTIAGVTGLWMEFVHGRTLEAELAERGSFSAEQLVSIGQELCGALASVHAAGLVHRDVKAQNVLREPGGRVVLGDFGTGLELDDCHARDSELAGTPVYLAPEVFNQQPATARSDLYSLGVLLFHLATGTYPVSGRNLTELRHAHQQNQRARLETHPTLPAQLAAAIDQSLDPDPRCRFESAGAMADALGRCQQVQAPAWSRRRQLAAASMVAGLAILTGFAWFSRPDDAHSRNPVTSAATSPANRQVSSSDPLFVLVTRFENRTGAEAFDDVVEYVLERELHGSGLRLAPTERVNDVLVLMQRAATNRVDASIGREVALRDGQIRVVIAGRIARLGSGVTLAADVIATSDGSIIASVVEHAPTDADLFAAVRRLANQLRLAVGGTPVSATAAQDSLPKVSAASLRALQLYSRAIDLQNRDGLWGSNRHTAEQLLKEAVREDPTFASAHVALSMAIRLDRTPRLAEAIAQLEHAIAVSDNVPAIERLAIEGELAFDRGLEAMFDRQGVAHFQRSAASFAAMLQIQPDHIQALICLSNANAHLAVNDATIPMRLADLRPNSVVWQMNAAQTALRSGEYDRGRQYARRGAALPFDAVRADASTIVALYDAYVAWLQNNAVEAVAVADRFSRDLEAMPPQIKTAAAPQLFNLYLTLGRFASAEPLLAVTNAGLRKLQAVRLAAVRDDAAAVRDLLSRLFPDTASSMSVISFLVDYGLVDAAQKATALAKTLPYTPALDLAEGELALAEDRIDEAIARLGSYLQHDVTVIGPLGRLRASLKLAEAWVAKGDLPRAIELLEQATADRQSVIERFAGWTWLRARERLAQLCRNTGRESDARKIEAELRLLLAVADSDHPIKRRLQSSRD